MPTKPKTEQLDKRISNIIDKRLDVLDNKQYKRWLKVTELSFVLNDWLQILTVQLNEYLPNQENIHKQTEKEVNQIKGELNNIKDISQLLKTICTSTVERVSTRPPPPPPPPKPSSSKPSSKNNSRLNQTTSSKKVAASYTRVGHDADEIRMKASQMNTNARKKKLAEFENKLQDVEKKAKKSHRLLQNAIAE